MCVTATRDELDSTEPTPDLRQPHGFGPTSIEIGSLCLLRECQVRSPRSSWRAGASRRAIAAA
jgi:hypothetical protein